MSATPDSAGQAAVDVERRPPRNGPFLRRDPLIANADSILLAPETKGIEGLFDLFPRKVLRHRFRQSLRVTITGIKRQIVLQTVKQSCQRFPLRRLLKGGRASEISGCAALPFTCIAGHESLHRITHRGQRQEHATHPRDRNRLPRRG
jgi:hypothetical protein